MNKLSWWDSWLEKKKKYTKCDSVFMDEDLFDSITVSTGLPPIYQQSNFSFRNVADGADRFIGKVKNNEKPYARIYTRLGNPNTEYLERILFRLECHHIIENALAAHEPKPTIGVLVTSSGMGAISVCLITLLNTGDELICGAVYNCTEALLRNFEKKYQIHTHFIDTTQLDLVQSTLEKNPKIKGIFIESPVNPTLVVNDISALSQLAEKFRIPLIVDNTFCSPYIQQPFRLGADIVIHSLTKYINGHSTSIGGALLGPWNFMQEAFTFYKDIGVTPSPFDSWLTGSNVQDLGIRVRKAVENAEKIVQFLMKHPRVRKVYYPFLGKQEVIARKQMRSGGAIISFEIENGLKAGVRLMDYFALHSTPMKLAVSLGCVISYIQHPASMTHAEMAPEVRHQMGISDDLIRLSVGIEGVSILIHALEEGLKLAYD
ncbi:MAG: aminotransferase class I/II-fold pyridoxal phosphate-dependent enzyme [Planctomycetota bacterium]